MYVIFTGYTCLATSVAAMGLVMYLNHDPDSSLGLAGGFLVFALVFAAVTGMLYLPLLRQPKRPDTSG
jgi:hypothetical protein